MSMKGEIRSDVRYIEKEIKYIEMRYADLIYFFISLGLVFIIMQPENFKMMEGFIANLGQYGLLGIFLTGMAYTTSFTSPIASVAAYAFGEFYHPLIIAALGALGSLIVDVVMYKLFRKVIGNHTKVRIARLPEHKLMQRFYPLIGWFIIASPLPDELGVAFLSVFDGDFRKFMLISYTANFAGLLFFSMWGMV